MNKNELQYTYYLAKRQSLDADYDAKVKALDADYDAKVKALNDDYDAKWSSARGVWRTDRPRLGRAVILVGRLYVDEGQS